MAQMRLKRYNSKKLIPIAGIYVIQNGAWQNDFSAEASAVSYSHYAQVSSSGWERITAYIDKLKSKKYLLKNISKIYIQSKSTGIMWTKYTDDIYFKINGTQVGHTSPAQPNKGSQPQYTTVNITNLTYINNFLNKGKLELLFEQYNSNASKASGTSNITINNLILYGS